MPRTTQELALEMGRQHELLRIHRESLHHLRLQEAKLGLSTPPVVMHQINDTETAIQKLETTIAHLELESAEAARIETQAERERQLIEAFYVQRAQAEGISTLRPIALAICALPNLRSIKPDVETYLQKRGWAMPIDEICIAGLNRTDDLAQLVVALQLKKEALQAGGYTEIHLFIAGPVVAGVAAGGIFDNWKPVKLYHKAHNTPEQSYEYWMPLIST